MDPFGLPSTANLPAQFPMAPILQARQAAPLMTQWGPFKLQDVMKLPGVASHVPQDLPADGICITVGGPPECMDQAKYNADDKNLCSMEVYPCSPRHNRTNSEDSVASLSPSENSDMEIDGKLTKDDEHEDEEIFTDSGPITIMATATVTANVQNKMPTSTGMNMARIPVTGVPLSVQDALINDNNAPRSLAREFSDNNSPDWYKQLPKEQRHLFMSERAPKVGPRPPKTTTSCDPPRHGEKGKNYRKQQRKIAHLRAKLAKKQSQLAEEISCSAMASSAKAETSRAAMEWKLGHGDPGKLLVSAAPSTVAVTKTSALYAISITIAAVTLGVALYL